MATYTKDEIKQFYDNGELEKAYDASIDLINEIHSENGTADSDLYVLAANLFLDLFANPLVDSVDDTGYEYYHLCLLATKNSENTQIYYENYRDLINEFYKWSQIYFLFIINQIIKEPSNEALEVISQLKYKLSVMKNKINLACRSCRFIISENSTTITDMFTKNDKFDFSDELDSEYIDSIKEPNYDFILYIKIDEWFSSFLKYYSDNRVSSSRSDSIVVAKKILLCLTLMESFAEDIYSEEETLDLLAKELLVKIKTLILDSTIEVDGCLISIFSNLENRQMRIDEIEELNNYILDLEPDYESLEIPKLEPYSPPQIPVHSYNESLFNNTSSNGCYVATAVYGSYDCPEVWTLRRYRDDMLAKTWHGRLFIYLYYAISPTIVRLFGDTMWFKNMWRGKLDKKVKQLQNNGVESTPYNDKNWRKER